MCSNAIALFKQKDIAGTVRFHQCVGKRGSMVTISLFNLTPYRVRAIHIHEFGDETEGCKSLGAHYNPKGTTHGSLAVEGMSTHAGDLINNIHPDGRGRFEFSYYDPRVKVKDILGRSVVVHDGEDDLGLGGTAESLKTGNAGGRMACAIIGLAKPGRAISG